jgi:hypothetical protein
LATRIVHLGKESNELEAVEAGALHDLGEVLNQYQSPRRDPWAALVRPMLRELGPRVVAELSGLSLSAVKEQLAGRSRPHSGNARVLQRVASTLAVDGLRASEVEPPRDELDCCAAFLALAANGPLEP